MKSKYEFRKSKMMMASNSRVWHIICLLLIVVFFCPFAYGKVIYVDDDAVGANDGSSWQNAYTFLQDALTDAEATNKPVEVCVGQGVYKPDQGIGITLGDRRTSFHLKNSVAIKGGYAGVNEPEPDIRDVGLFQTILSGDLSGNDIDVNNPGNLYDLPDRYDDSEIVVTCSNTDSTAVLDSFTITGGYISVIAYRLGGGPSGGAGMLISSGSPTLINCTFTDNATTNSGGGLLIYDDSNPTLLNCKFIRNYAGSGGGLFSSTSSPTLINCIFSDNYAQHQGGGIYNVSGNPILTNCTFRRNSTYGSLCLPIARSLKTRQLLVEECSTKTVTLS
jgi:parallel beta-helix repeat protein